MTTATLTSAINTGSTKRSAIIAGATAALALAAMGFASSAEARGDVSFSVGVGLPGVAVGVSNAYPVYGGYPQPVYVEPAPVYYEPPPVYYRPRPVYVQPAPVYYQRSQGWRGRHGGYYRDRDGDGRSGGHSDD